MILSWRNRGALLAMLLAAVTFDVGMGFVSPSPSRGLMTRASFGRSIVPAGSFVTKARPGARTTTSLRMSDDFNESKYTEAAWAAMIALSKAADYYDATTIEAPILLDVLLNPTKHNAGEEAESARRVAEKCLGNAGVDVKLMRMELDKFLAKQAKVSNMTSQKTLGGNLQKVLDNSRTTKDILGVSLFSCCDGGDCSFALLTLFHPCRTRLCLRNLLSLLYARKTHSLLVISFPSRESRIPTYSMPSRRFENNLDQPYHAVPRTCMMR